jgi:hypothetical protein
MPTPTPLLPRPTITPEPTIDISKLPPLPPLESPFVASGVLSYRQQVLVPDQARIVVVWAVSAPGSDVGYLFGEGTVNSKNGIFEIVLDTPPPPEALNWVGSTAYGMGVLLITTDPGLGIGILPDSDHVETSTIGAAERYALIYIYVNLETWAGEGWVNEFDQGYSMGRAVDVPDSSFDELEPVDPTSIEMIIAYWENLQFADLW